MIEENEISPVSSCADTIMRHGLKPGGSVKIVRGPLRKYTRAKSSGVSIINFFKKQG